MGGRFPLTVQSMCQRMVPHDPFANCHTTPIKEWHKVRHMLTLKKDQNVRSNYARDAIKALVEYNQYASEHNNEVEQMMLDAQLEQYTTWAPRLDNISEAIRSGSAIVEVPVERIEQLEQRSRDAEEALMDQLRKEDEDRARRKEKKRKEKDRRAQSSDPTPAQPTVSLLDYQPPSESSSNEAEVAKKLDFEGEVKSEKAEVLEPTTPEQLLAQPSADQGLTQAHHPWRWMHQKGLRDKMEPMTKANRSPKNLHLTVISRKKVGNRARAKPKIRRDHLPILQIRQNLLIQMLLIQILMRKRMKKTRRREKRVKKERRKDARKRTKKEVDDLEEVVESESTKKKRKMAEHQEKVSDAATTRLPFALSDKGPLYKGVQITPNDRPSPSFRWRAKRGAIPKPKDKSPIDHKGNRAFENIRDHQISSLFTLQKHLADCEKGSKERNSTLNPLRTATGEYSPCKKEMTTAQTDDGVWRYEYSDLPALFPMKYGMKTFDIIEQIPFNLTPQGPHKNLVRQIVEELGIEVKRKRVKNKDVYFIDDLPTAMNPEAIRAARGADT